MYIYRFADDDTKENILFDEQEEGKFKSSNEALIKACTIYKLIERVTYHEYAGFYNVYIFYMLHTHVYTYNIICVCVHVLFIYVYSVCDILYISSVNTEELCCEC